MRKQDIILIPSNKDKDTGYFFAKICHFVLLLSLVVSVWEWYKYIKIINPVGILLYYMSANN